MMLSSRSGAIAPLGGALIVVGLLLGGPHSSAHPQDEPDGEKEKYADRPKGRRIVRAEPSLPRELLIEEADTFEAGAPGRILFGVCDLLESTAGVPPLAG